MPGSESNAQGQKTILVQAKSLSKDKRSSQPVEYFKQTVFLEFANKRNCPESIEFLQKVIDIEESLNSESEKTGKSIKELSELNGYQFEFKNIYDQYISNDATTQINLSSKMRNILENENRINNRFTLESFQILYQEIKQQTDMGVFREFKLTLTNPSNLAYGTMITEEKEQDVEKKEEQKPLVFISPQTSKIPSPTMSPALTGNSNQNSKEYISKLNNFRDTLNVILKKKKEYEKHERSNCFLCCTTDKKYIYKNIESLILPLNSLIDNWTENMNDIFIDLVKTKLYIHLELSGKHEEEITNCLTQAISDFKIMELSKFKL